MRIGEVAKASGIGVETVRFYEQKGLVAQPPRPLDGGYRVYPADAVNRIRFIRSAQALGFSLTEVAELLALEARDSAECADVRETARAKRQEVQAKIASLVAIRRALDKLIETCPGSDSAQSCSILEAINSGELHLSDFTKEKANGNNSED